MENQRFFLYASLIVVLYLLWSSWQQQKVLPSINTATPKVQQNYEAPIQTLTTKQDIPNAIDANDLQPETAKEAIVVNTQKNEYITVKTDVFNLMINTRGGDIHRVELSDYLEELDNPNQPFVLLDDINKTYIAQSGLVHDPLANQEVSHRAPNHYEVFTAKKNNYVLGDGDNELIVPLTWQNNEGIQVTKRLIFKRGEYLIDIDYEVSNQSDADWLGRQYRQLRHSYIETEKSLLRLPTYTGAAYYDGKYEKLSFGDMVDKPLKAQITGGWAAMLQHYFFSAWLAEEFEKNDYYSNIVNKAVGSDYIIGMRSEPTRIERGETYTFQNRLYVGPKLQKYIEQIQPGLELTTDYGIFTPLCKPLFWILDFINKGLHNWGLAIILVTLLIKLVFYRLSAASYKSMARMRKVQPKMMSLRERYADDKQKLNQAMWDLYKKEQINPLGGCLPILIQMPVFLSLYWVLIESVEMRHAPFMLWINDLSSKDPLFILPLLMGISMWVQFKLNPKPTDPMQEKVFMLMPVFMMAFMAFFPAGLVLYWFVNNLLSIGQQWYITKRYAE